MSEFDYGTGRRKNATARTRLYAGNGAIEVNGRKVEDYFPRKTLQRCICGNSCIHRLALFGCLHAV